MHWIYNLFIFSDSAQICQRQHKNYKEIVFFKWFILHLWSAYLEEITCPHYDLQSHFFVKWFEIFTISIFKEYKTIILLIPNHYMFLFRCFIIDSNKTKNYTNFKS
ncbi:hypothetical protein EDEG_00058 [Edhazardia aedis USNM 41457]|uniref:Uncharacterized protein n=1 Tax=Edhazardia aedis (strain USNM 41457) TaxID=1003232 RepID=J8ZZY2_EDHAE|nr:hypothetical protein EDEG_00058 [Edhazardia aedis USNM 41457]|eukprot:EJW05203.1 hypothetical protein EDEG_00058 [Edhazardia aedis USNM 41457]